MANKEATTNDINAYLNDSENDNVDGENTSTNGNATDKKSRARKTTCDRAGLSWPITKVNRDMKGVGSVRVSKHVPVFVSGALECVIAEVIAKANDAKPANETDKRRRIHVSDIIAAVSDNADLCKTFSHVTFVNGTRRNDISKQIKSGK
tara:strand:+ start:3488 stop:3937 length:450 start_codon:yes stop_codon:yes gene_type:complete